MTDREVYTKAAMRIGKDNCFSCSAIYSRSGSNNPGTVAHRTRYRAAFGFAADMTEPWDRGNLPWKRDRFLALFPLGQEGLELRVWCLLMMAAACDDI